MILFNGKFDAGIYGKQYDDDNYFVYWEGFLYIPGVAAGESSVVQFLQSLQKLEISAAVASLCGNYFALILDKRAGIYYAFIDNSGCYDAFYTNKTVSTSFLQLIKTEGLSAEQLSDAAIVEYFNMGGVYCGNTLFDCCKRIMSNVIITYSYGKSGTLKKKIPEIYDAPNQDYFLGFFEKFANTIRNKCISVDLTGGIDSRLLVALLQHFEVPVEVTTVGREGLTDVEIPKEIVKVLGCKHFVTPHTIETLENEFETLFVLSEGLMDLFDCHRSWQQNQNRLARGVNLAISGAGGELYKDFYWLHDFPFYGKKSSNIAKLVDMRILPIACNSNYFTGQFKEINDHFRHAQIVTLHNYALWTNTQTYDNIYFNYKMKTMASRIITNSNRMLDTYSPLLESDLVRYGFSLRRRDRFFNNFHRGLITKLNPRLAKIRTSEGGISVSSERADVLQDITKYVCNKGMRLGKKLGQKYLRRTYFQESPANSGIYQKIRKMSLAQECLAILKEQHIIRPELTLVDLPDSHLGRFITLGRLLQYIATKE